MFVFPFVCFSFCIIWGMRLNNATPSPRGAMCTKHSVRSAEILNCQFLRSASSTSGWGRHGGGKKKTPPRPSFRLKRFINELNVSAQNLFSHHALSKTSRKWFMLNGVCQICQLIKWSFALSIHFSVTAFHWVLQLSTRATLNKWSNRAQIKRHYI